MTQISRVDVKTGSHKLTYETCRCQDAKQGIYAQGAEHLGRLDLSGSSCTTPTRKFSSMVSLWSLGSIYTVRRASSEVLMKENLKRKDYSGVGVDAYCTKIFTVPRGKRFALCYTSFFDHFAIEYLTNVFLRKNVRTLGLREICQLWTTLQQNIWTNQAAQLKTH